MKAGISFSGPFEFIEFVLIQNAELCVWLRGRGRFYLPTILCYCPALPLIYLPTCKRGGWSPVSAINLRPLDDLPANIRHTDLIISCLTQFHPPEFRSGRLRNYPDWAQQSETRLARI